jgi:hypothetical protein
LIQNGAYSLVTRGSWLAMVFAVTACAADRMVSIDAGASTHHVSASAGDRVNFTLQTIGPGEFESPPGISSAAVAFVDVVSVVPAVPAGPTQQFRFRAVSTGTAVVTFTGSFDGRVIQDTVVVR